MNAALPPDCWLVEPPARTAPAAATAPRRALVVKRRPARRVAAVRHARRAAAAIPRPTPLVPLAHVVCRTDVPLPTLRIRPPDVPVVELPSTRLIVEPPRPGAPGHGWGDWEAPAPARGVPEPTPAALLALAWIVAAWAAKERAQP